jgi:hypothetical protein
MLHPKQTKIMHMRMCFTSETSGRMELRCVLPRAPRGEQAAWPLGRIGPLGVWDLAQLPIPQGGAACAWRAEAEQGARLAFKLPTSVCKAAPDSRRLGKATNGRVEKLVSTRSFGSNPVKSSFVSWPASVLSSRRGPMKDHPRTASLELRCQCHDNARKRGLCRVEPGRCISVALVVREGTRKAQRVLART